MSDLHDLPLALERAALDRWIQGDPMGFAESAGEDITYCEPFLPGRLDGREAFVARIASLQGQIRGEGYELLEPVVVSNGELALLTFGFRAWTGASESRWMASEVYRLSASGWRLIHSHWSRPAQS